jgi:hypothetical protein
MIERRQLQADLWNHPEETPLTDHQRDLRDRLDVEEYLEIRGPVGCGKTFTVRHYLRRENIPFAYYTVTKLLTKGEEIVSEANYENVDVVIIDNFDVAPDSRPQLEEINELIEMELRHPTRTIWLIIPNSWDNKWFETLLGEYRTENLSNKKINRVHVSQVLENFRGLVPEEDQIPEVIDPSERELNETGYHTVIRKVCDQT